MSRIPPPRSDALAKLKTHHADVTGKGMRPSDRNDWPIIYVRGYAMTQGEIDEVTTDPFCGFNLGSTTIRATAHPDKKVRKFLFESPIVRLQSDFGYCDVYENGLDIVDPEWSGGIPAKSIVIYRYYDQASTFFGEAKTPPIETFARGLSELILKVRELVCSKPENNVSQEGFRCYLVAHSMGGLVCRAFLQNAELGEHQARRSVDKFFTYATPHNGIDLGGFNPPSWLRFKRIDTFNRKRMAVYLAIRDLFARTKRVDWLPENAFPWERVFCLVGTNRGDYKEARKLSSAFAGHGSDGLVRIENASVWGTNDDGTKVDPCATAYVYRSHSGQYGIVNSEESYQNLVRFLFGDIRVDIWVYIGDLRVPQELEDSDRKGILDALYTIELLASPRGKRWFLSRRVAVEDSVACRTHAELRRDASRRDVYLSSVFLSNRDRANPANPTLAYGVTLGVPVPDYEIESKFWPNRHYEGVYLFHESLAIELTPPETEGTPWRVKYDWQKNNVGQASTDITVETNGPKSATFTIPFHTGDATPPRSPGVSGQLRFVVSKWN